MFWNVLKFALKPLSHMPNPLDFLRQGSMCKQNPHTAGHPIGYTMFSTVSKVHGAPKHHRLLVWALLLTVWLCYTYTVYSNTHSIVICTLT